MDKYREELIEFLATPGMTKKDREEVKMYGQTAYTSSTLKSKLKYDLIKYAPSYSKAIFEKLIDSGDLVPVFLTKSLLQYLSKKKELNLQLLGEYYPREDKIFIYMESILRYTTLKIFVSTKPGTQLIQTLFHELMHMANNRNPKKFYEINRIPLLKFNSYVFFKYFKIKGDDKKGAMLLIDEFNKRIIEFLSNRYMPEKAVKWYLNEIANYSSLPQEEIDDLVDTYYNTMYYWDKSRQYFKHSTEIAKIMQEAYKKLFKLNIDLSWINEEIIVYDGIIAKLAGHNPNLPYVKKSLRLIV